MESSGGGRGDDRSRAFDFDLNVELEFDRLGREAGPRAPGGDLEPPAVRERDSGGGRSARAAGTSEAAAEAAAPNGSARGARSETIARILWAIPWIAVAITIVVLGGLTFAAAMVVFAFIGLSELFRMVHADRPAADRRLRSPARA